MSKPVAVFIIEDSIYGRMYLPGNKNAVNCAGLAGTRRIPEDRLPYIRALGFEVAEANGQPIPHPKASVDVMA